MIRTLLTAGAIAAAAAFVAGCYVGTRMTLKVVDIVDRRKKVA